MFVCLSHFSHVWLCSPWTVTHQAPLSMESPGKTTAMGCRFLLHGIFPTQGSNPSLFDLSPALAGGFWEAPYVYIHSHTHTCCLINIQYVVTSSSSLECGKKELNVLFFFLTLVLPANTYLIYSRPNFKILCLTSSPCLTSRLVRGIFFFFFFFFLTYLHSF